MLYDLVIIGGGPAALSAGIYSARKKTKTLLIAKSFGGQMLESFHIDNYLAVPEISGVQLAQRMAEHLKKFSKEATLGAFDLEIKEGEKVKNIRPEMKESTGSGQPKFYEVHTDRGIYQTKSVIIATGKIERKLDIPGSREFEGKGITYCATCDAPLFRDKIVAVIGGGDAGQDAAWQLTKYASRIYLLNKYEEFRGDNKDLEEPLRKESKVEILFETEPKEIFGDKFVKGLVYKNNKTGQEQKIEVDGIFVEIGSTPASLFIDGLLKCNERGEIIIDHNTCATSALGVFAAGDVTDVSQKQIIIAAGQGALAALSAYEYLKNK